MVVWLSCYAFVPFIFVYAYDKAKKIYNKCCKKKGANKNIEKVSKEEKNKIKEEIEKEEDNSKAKND